MPVGTSSPAVIGFADAGNEKATFRVFGIPLTAGNFVAQQALWTTLKAKVSAIVLGAVTFTEYGNKITELWAQPTNGAAREIKLLVQMKDTTTGERFTASIPTVDPTIPVYVVNVNAKDIVDPTTPTSIVDLATAINAFAISPITGNALEVIGLKVARGLK